MKTCYYGLCDGTGLIPFIKNEKVIPDTSIFCPCNEQYKDSIYKNIEIQHCSNCYHFVDDLCSCREKTDMIKLVNRCRDWYTK